MTDLEMTRLCAEAMCLRVDSESGNCALWCVERVGAAGHDDGVDRDFLYSPLYHDAQAMALVKRFKLDINHVEDAKPVWVSWFAADYGERDGDLDGGGDTRHVSEGAADENRAIVTCVARMQKSTPSAPDQTGGV